MWPQPGDPRASDVTGAVDGAAGGGDGMDGPGTGGAGEAGAETPDPFGVAGGKPGAVLVRRRYLDVVEEVLRSIAVGAITTGDRLPNERDLAARCAVSRSSVREALLALELGGIIEVRAGAGCYLTGMGIHADPLVAPLADSSPRELLEMRQVIEPTVARRSAARASADALARLRRLVDESEQAIDASDPEDLDQFVDLSLGFHRELARTCGNAIMAGFMGHLVNAGEHPLWLLIDGIVVRDRATRARQVAEHGAILDAVTHRQGDEAAALMNDHLGALSARIFGPASQRPKVQRSRRRRPT